ncbi:MliC family protein [Gemmobacter fulvus]|uniref:MliC family protein n=1 Tax=Gemmobacter fulvus TaxID=2840474 RepID=A0A975P7D6_9RHOB|nr:MliC family protein [Gemmobacter fulvus]MBT9244325.1 MliC family protein [Gemmobacter fulvus]QWK91210.1 MliC family protein [Gemmobacter fulvus]
MLRLITPIALSFALPVLADTAPEPAQPATDLLTQTYHCDRGAQVLATYINIGADSFAVLGFEGRQIGFSIAQSASGARYLSVDPALPFVWWTKGDTAMMLYGSGDDEAMIYAECVLR